VWWVLILLFPKSPNDNTSSCNRQTWKQEWSVSEWSSLYLVKWTVIFRITIKFVLKHVTMEERKISGPNPLNHEHVQYCWIF
jgi:hypothetical protein